MTAGGGDRSACALPDLVRFKPARHGLVIRRLELHVRTVVQVAEGVAFAVQDAVAPRWGTLLLTGKASPPTAPPPKKKNTRTGARSTWRPVTWGCTVSAEAYLVSNVSVPGSYL